MLYLPIDPYKLFTVMSQARATTGHLTQTVKRCLTMGTSAAKERGSPIPSPVLMAVLELPTQVTVREAAPNTLP